MKFGIRKPSIKKSLKARTTGRLKRTMKKAVNPFYGKKGFGFINNPKKAIYNKVYNKTTVDSRKLINISKNKKTKVNNFQNEKKTEETENIKNKSGFKGVTMKKSSVIRNIIGGFFIFTGFVGMFSSGLLAGIFMLLFGVSLLPIFYEKVKLNIKHIQIILPIILIFMSVMTMPEATTETNSNINETNANIIQEEKNIEITELKFNESEIEIDIKENKEIVLEILPDNANIDTLEFCTSNNQIAILEKSSIENIENNVTLKIKPIAEGNCEIYAKSTNGIESNKIILNVIDNERIEKEKREAEEQAKKEAEEQAKKQAEEKAKKEAEEQSKKQAEEQSKKQTQSTTSQNNNKNSQTTSSQQSTTSSSSQSNSNNTHGKAVYRTPKGAKYHFDPDCGGPNSYQTTLDAATSVGLTPCKKCAQ